MTFSANRRVTAAGILLMTHPPAREFLLLRHPDRWDLPKGHCDPGEDFRQTALRETEEETGVDPSQICLDPDFFFDIEYPVRYQDARNRTYTKQVRYFLGRLNSQPELVLSEHGSARWFAWNPPHHIQPRTIDPLLAAVAEHLEKRADLPNADRCREAGGDD